jgi:hypothetical protein
MRSFRLRSGSDGKSQVSEGTEKSAAYVWNETVSPDLLSDMCSGPATLLICSIIPPVATPQYGLWSISSGLRPHDLGQDQSIWDVASSSLVVCHQYQFR